VLRIFIEHVAPLRSVHAAHVAKAVASPTNRRSLREDVLIRSRIGLLRHQQRVWKRFEISVNQSFHCALGQIAGPLPFAPGAHDGYVNQLQIRIPVIAVAKLSHKLRPVFDVNRFLRVGPPLHCPQSIWCPRSAGLR
jgi:hypothetical protein